MNFYHGLLRSYVYIYQLADFSIMIKNTYEVNMSGTSIKEKRRQVILPAKDTKIFVEEQKLARERSELIYKIRQVYRHFSFLLRILSLYR